MNTWWITTSVGHDQRIKKQTTRQRKLEYINGFVAIDDTNRIKGASATVGRLRTYITGLLIDFIIPLEV